MKDKIKRIVIKAIKNLNEEINSPNFNTINDETQLYGDKGNLDSMGLVVLVLDIELMVADKFQKTITLADEKAISQTRSPFKNVKSLTAYIESLLEVKNE